MASNDYLVVGGSSGIGLEIVRQLSKNGHRIVVASRQATDKLTELAGVSYLPYDATEDTLPEQDLPETLQGMVYCPGTIRLKPIQRLTDEDFLEDFQVNVMGAVRTVRSVLTRLKKSRQGSAIVLFSTVAVQTGMPFHASVSAAKGAVEGLTRSLAAELAPRIRVNAVAPSMTDTPLAETLLSDDAKREASAERHPLKRVGSASEPAGTAVFLLGETAGWISGQVFFVDGGMSALRTFR